MKEAILYQKLPKNKVRCGVCQRRCIIPDGDVGYCKTRVNKNGKLYATIYGIASAINNDPIEKKPVFHYKPGSSCLSLGTFGCNFKCLFCQNWNISWADGVAEARHGTKLNPQQAIKLAQKYNSEGIAITYNEPTIWLEYSLDVFKLAKKNHLYTVWVTNGYATKETIDIIVPYLDVYRVDLKSFDDHFYQKLINVPRASGVFETTKYLHQKYPEIHLECVTNIIPTWNDQPKTLASIAQWIKKNLGGVTPWHVTRFYPDAELNNVPPTPPETLFKAREIGLEAGLSFVYIGNLPVEKEDDTYCPKCGNLAIRRTGYLTEILGVDQKGRCLDCQEDLNIKR
ncbi:AmmeMemoRadiSam system radical SAM enzyme [Candidatus Shapirobacteria bacterium CG07_land_8_20_14_0_80_39_12]|uniref:AmmeMemoRadiSam system radical SAM enzyme n=1 Tax=Candidatus Shapirobacteria bacterium CG07_land_8_20_14_0_80_39_12 TaxID=1974480 RepID=A0A2M6YPM5_9BACT|nr:MAG: AmmeMemoRadiSam system radical SAM enzyme [Candidatus Shapirobacteria bacterium CG07_land_8_20_14_0_80_39_12]